MKYALISDTHNHNWSAFAKPDPDGVNSRLRIILNETWRAAVEAKKAGCEALIHAGDLFHVRGSVAPSVLNPTADLYRNIREELGLSIFAVSGNHDLEGKEAQRLTSAVSALIGWGVQVVNEPTIVGNVVLIPWGSVAQQKVWLEHFADALKSRVGEFDVVMHAPINGVIMGIPDHGFDPGMLASLGFKRIFAGHYHNHVDFGVGVYSIGALTHQTWSDVGTKAGFLIVDDEQVRYFASHAPSFIDLREGIDHDELALLVDGNYVRARLDTTKASDVEEFREYLLGQGAAGVVIHAINSKAAVTRVGATVKTGASIEESIAEYIKAKGFDNQKRLQALCFDLLAKVEEA